MPKQVYPYVNVGHGMTKTVTNDTLVEQLKASGRFKNPLYEEAFRNVLREHFLPGKPLERVYVDEAISTKIDSRGVTISSSSQPTMMIQMLDQMNLERGQNVLEIGTGTGYNAAIMQYIVGSEGKVTTMELDADIANQAEQNLHNAGFSQVHVVNDDGSAGYSPRATYDAILCTAAIWDIPEAWVRQLKPNGVIVTPIQLDGAQVSGTFRLDKNGHLVSTYNLPCRFVYLRGISKGPELIRSIGSTGLRLISARYKHIDPAGLHVLLSSDQEICQLSKLVDDRDYWWGFANYAVLNQPQNFVVTIFNVNQDEIAYGITGSGVALISNGSATFFPYGGIGKVFCFAGSDAFLVLEDLIIEWINEGKPGVAQLEIRFIPREKEKPTPNHGRIYERHDHYLHAWLDTGRSKL